MSDLTLIGSPFHLGARGVNVGAGPLELLADDAAPAALRSAGHDLELAWLADPSPAHEVARVFELNRALAEPVAEARRRGRLPVVVSGNCIVCLGAIGGLEADRAGIVWLDAHPDFNTPETTGTGFLDGMGLAAATGACWTTLARSIPGFAPIDERDTVLVGVRDIDPSERERLDAGEVTVIEGGAGPGTLPIPELKRALGAAAAGIDGVYLHLDLDAIDPSLGRANEHATDGGLGIDDVLATVTAAAERTPILAISFTGYDPSADPQRRFGPTAVEAVGAAIDAATGRPTS